MLSDTIAAIATPLGEASIGIIRISGSNAIEIGKKIFLPKKNANWYKKDNYKLVYGHIVDPQTKNVIDEILLSVMRGPNSFTGEDVIELSCHGGIVSVKMVLQLVLRSGARMAEPGEFSKRAFINGRLDLAQAESIIDLIKAKTDAGANIALSQLGGRLSEKVSGLQDDLLGLLAKIEAIIDFPEDDIAEATINEIANNCQQINRSVQTLLENAETGKIYREGISTVIVGKPNVGKSSLLNALLQEQRAIVTEIPGTTRDVIEEIINIKGVPLKIIDTAGFRETQDLVEKLGVERSRQLLNRADLILFILDASTGLTEEDYEVMKLLHEKPVLILINKIDIAVDSINKNEIINKIGKHRILEISAKEEIGLNELRQMILDLVLEGKILSSNDILVSSARHKNALERVKVHLDEAAMAIVNYVPPDIVSIDIKNAWEILGEITGNTVGEDIIDKIFADFCIGK